MLPLLLIDGDIVAFRCASSAEGDNVRIARARMEEMLVGIFDDLRSDRYRIFISGENNFRHSLYPQYKANRVSRPRPRFLEDCREHLIKYWNAELADGWEADDELGIAQTEAISSNSPSIICSIDKDLKQVPGMHWNFVKKESDDVSDIAGLRRFYTQVLTGDSTDNVPGLPGIGPVKAKGLLGECDDPTELFQRTRTAFDDDSYFHLMGCLIWILREPGKIWEFPQGSASGRTGTIRGVELVNDDQSILGETSMASNIEEISETLREPE